MTFISRFVSADFIGVAVAVLSPAAYAQEVTASGVDGLIGKLVERNKQLAAKKVAG